MARKSAASLAIVPAAGIQQLPPAPAELSEAEVVLWNDIVESKPADWFGPDSLPILKEYVRAAVMCDTIAKWMQDGIHDMKVLCDMRDKEARRAVSLATKLRLTPQSRYGPRDADRADKRAGGKRPWQTIGNLKREM